MKKQLRRLITVCALFCLTLCIGLFAACGGGKTPEREPEEDTFSVTVYLADGSTPAAGVYVGICGYDETDGTGTCLNPVATGSDGVATVDVSTLTEENYTTAEIHLSNLPSGYIYADSDGVEYAKDKNGAYTEGVRVTLSAGSATITLTAEEEEESGDNIPTDFVKEENVTLGVWGSTALSYYTLYKGETITLTGSFSGKSANVWEGIVGQVTPIGSSDSTVDYYFFRPDCPVVIQSDVWNYWQGSIWDTSEWVEASYSAATAGDVDITVELSGRGVLVYTVHFTETSDGGYEYTNVFTASATMESATVGFATDTVTASDVTIVHPIMYTYTFDYNHDDVESDTYTVRVNTTYTFGTDPTRTGYVFEGWLYNGNTYYAGDEITVSASATFVAQWRAAVAGVDYAIELTAGTAVTVSVPLASYTNKLTGNTVIGWSSDYGDGVEFSFTPSASGNYRITVVSSYSSDDVYADIYAGAVYPDAVNEEADVYSLTADTTYTIVLKASGNSMDYANSGCVAGDTITYSVTVEISTTGGQ